VKFNLNLARRPGFSSTATYVDRAMGMAPEPDGIDVYCDLLEPVPVDDVKVPLSFCASSTSTRK